jgi:hypothetical protein
MTRPYNVDKVIDRTLELLGGPERAREITDRDFGEMAQRWNQDVDAIGRILRAHLYVEHYMTEYVRHANPRLGSIADARLSFNQKLALLDDALVGVSEIKPGIAQLNKIRNRLAHRLCVQLESKDVAPFLAAPMFTSMREVATGRSTSSLPPLEVLELFAQHAAHILAGEFNSFARAFGQALKEDKERSDA